MKKINKIIGGVLILAGTVVGAGMLALPIVCSGMGFVVAAIMLAVICSLMIITGLLTLEVNLAFKLHRNNLVTMSEATLGRGGKIISWIVTLLLLYALASAYISGNASLLKFSIQEHTSFNLPDYLIKFLVAALLGGIVCWSTSAVDFFNRSFLSVKGILFILVVSMIAPRVNFAQLINSGSSIYIAASVPILIAAFGFHPTIPSVTNYVGIRPKALIWIIVLGALIPLFMYLAWIFAMLGVVPITGKHGFASFANQVNSFDLMLISVSRVVSNHFVSACINGFSYVAMTTSFLGVTLGLFDFLADGFDRSNSVSGRLQTGALTFLPPLMFTIFYPNGFACVLGYAAFFAAILVIIMPALMAYKLRKSKKIISPIRVFGGTWLLVAMVLAGVSVMVFEVLLILHKLPVFGA